MGCHVASDYRDAQRISVPGHTVYGAPHDPCGSLVRRRPRPQDTQERNRFCAHHKHIPDNPADTCCCTLKRFHSGRMVMALYLEDYGKPVTDIDGTCILTGALDDPVPGRGKKT
jgi:hypothetical protein